LTREKIGREREVGDGGVDKSRMSLQIRGVRELTVGGKSYGLGLARALGHGCERDWRTGSLGLASWACVYF
jgi:hypothetical protein